MCRNTFNHPGRCVNCNARVWEPGSDIRTDILKPKAVHVPRYGGHVPLKKTHTSKSDVRRGKGLHELESPCVIEVEMEANFV